MGCSEVIPFVSDKVFPIFRVLIYFFQVDAQLYSARRPLLFYSTIFPGSEAHKDCIVAIIHGACSSQMRAELRCRGFTVISRNSRSKYLRGVQLCTGTRSRGAERGTASACSRKGTESLWIFAKRELAHARLVSAGNNRRRVNWIIHFVVFSFVGRLRAFTLEGSVFSLFVRSSYSNLFVT